MKILYLCEKPSQARDIACHLKVTDRQQGYLEGNDYQVTWCIGHLLSLAGSEYYREDIKPWRFEKLPIIPDVWHKQVVDKAKFQLTVIKSLLRETQHVVIATDPDREGECIAREVLAHCRYQGKLERLWLRALDNDSIKKALANIQAGDTTEHLYHAALARAQADWLIGMNATMAASSLYGVNGVLSIGRVQTPTLKLVVDRDRAIQAFQSSHYYELVVDFGDEEQSVAAKWQAPASVLDEHGHCLLRDNVEAIAAMVEDESARVESFTLKDKQQAPPLGFSLSALQKKASSLYGFSAKQVLQLAQALYENHKATTYPRTDCAYLPESQWQEAQAVLTALVSVDGSLDSVVSQCDISLQSNIWNDAKVSAHHAIIPTASSEVNLDSMSADELKVYQLIRERYLAQFLGDYYYQQQQLIIRCAGEVFSAESHLPLQMGWKQLLSDKTELEDKALPVSTEGDWLQNQGAHVLAKQTKPPAYFTEGTLIDAMKHVGKAIADTDLKQVLVDTHGIGTEATRANIIETLFQREYLKRQGKQVRATDKGCALIDLVPDVIKNPLLTAKWEQALEDIAEGKVTKESFMQQQTDLLHEMLAALKEVDKTQLKAIMQLQSDSQNGKVYLCPECESPLRRLKNKKGKHFWGCSSYSLTNCGFTTWEKQGKPSL